jgi:isopentenyl-diphosphate delta-isomerase
MTDKMNTSNRKIEHLTLCATHEVEAHNDEHGHRRTGFDDITFIHNALPQINMDKIETTIDFLGEKFAFPLLISSMTGGHPDTLEVNRALALAAEEMQIGIGVGSQRAALEDPALEDSFRVVRDSAPDIFVFGNLGISQIQEYGIEGVEQAVEMIDADAIAIHLNFLQEAVQPEGNTNACGGLELIRQVCQSMNIPVIVKETGCGISYKVAQVLCDAGVSAIDVGGLGGTSWAGVEVYRAKEQGANLCERLGNLLWDWGIPTPISVIESSISVPVIATGGIRTGMDIAKSLAVGASLCGTALPLIKPALSGSKEVIKRLRTMLEELKVVMFLTGYDTIEDLMQAPVVITGRTAKYLNERGFNTKHFAER